MRPIEGGTSRLDGFGARRQAVSNKLRLRCLGSAMPRPRRNVDVARGAEAGLLLLGPTVIHH
jgi:hypothetical protein